MKKVVLVALTAVILVTVSFMIGYRVGARNIPAVTVEDSEPATTTTVTTPTLELEVEPTEPIEVVEVVEIAETVEVTEPVEVTETVDNTNLGRFKLTAYCACEQCCGEYANGITATGTVATQGRTIAVDPSVIPYGSEVIINGHTYIAEDCGGAIKENRIDVYFDNHSDALQFGVQYADVYIMGS